MRRRSRYGFSIVELLVVIGIIALLLTILLPSVGRAREMSKRTACAANLRTLGIAGRAFATNHNGRFPVCFGTPAPDPADMKRMAVVVSLDSKLMADEALWKRVGIPMSEWDKYGAPESVWKCPASQYDFRYYNIPGAPVADNWGPIVWTDFMWVAGLRDKAEVIGKSRGRWGLLQPAVYIGDPNPADRILAADAAFYAGSGAWGRQFHINHPDATVAQKVGYQAVLYADGRVEANNMSLFPKVLHSETGRYSLKYDNKNGQNGFFFWGPEMSYTPGQAVPPPAPPPTPNPNPPAPNPNPAPPPPPPPPSNTNPLP
jgi:prepilin-type N-terminal cleavage/methylation domain-containing protein